MTDAVKKILEQFDALPKEDQRWLADVDDQVDPSDARQHGLPRRAHRGLYHLVERPIVVSLA